MVLPKLLLQAKSCYHKSGYQPRVVVRTYKTSDLNASHSKESEVLVQKETCYRIKRNLHQNIVRVIVMSILHPMILFTIGWGEHLCHETIMYLKSNKI